MLLALSAFLLGFVHGLGADHLMAIAALSAHGRDDQVRGKVFRVALRFACGHAVVLGASAAAVLLFGWQVPVVLERGGELVSGWLLVVLGGMGFWVLINREVYTPAHVHSSNLARHLSFGSQNQRSTHALHSYIPTALGAIFAVSGLRALTLLTSFSGAEAENGSLLALLGFVTIFTMGIVLAMCSFGILLAQLMSSRILLGVSRIAAGVTAAASILLGIYWLAVS